MRPLEVTYVLVPELLQELVIEYGFVDDPDLLGLDGAMSRLPADGDLAVRHVVGQVGLGKTPFRIGLDLDVVGAVRTTLQRQGLARTELFVRVARARGQDLAN